MTGRRLLTRIGAVVQYMAMCLAVTSRNVEQNAKQPLPKVLLSILEQLKPKVSLQSAVFRIVANVTDEDKKM